MKRIFTLILAVMPGLLGHTEENRPALSRILLHSTVRIETTKAAGKRYVGTGFFYQFDGPGSNDSIPVVVTCWHVVSGAEVGRMYFAEGTTNAAKRLQAHLTIDFKQYEKVWIRHPDTNIDLAIMPVAPILRDLTAKGRTLDYVPIDERLIPSDSELLDYGAFEEIRFIGYPIGIWDEKNNLPVARRGMTATDPSVDYNGRSEFLVDASVFPGSSGSPVYMCEEGGIHQQGSNVFIGAGSRVRFLGILYAVFEHTAAGKLEVVTIPSALDDKVKTRMPANLGLVVKASRIKDFKPVLEKPRKMP